MNAFQSIVYVAIHLALLGVPLLGTVWLLYSLWQRRRKSADIAAGAPLGCGTSRVVEFVVIVAGCILLTAFAITQSEWRNLLFSDAASSSLSVWGAAATTFAVIGLIAALAFAWQGAGSVAVVALLVTVFGYTAAVVSADRVDRMGSLHSRGWNKQEFPDLNLVLDVGGCNVVAAEMRANGVLLGKTPVRIKLSEFLAKVPDWKKAPGPTRKTESTTARGSDAAEAMPDDPRWGTLRLPELPFIRLPAAIENALRERQGRYIYIQCEYDGERGESTGGSGFGGGGDNFSATIGFRFPKREAAIERLLNQARLADYAVDPEWFQAAAAIGPDVWIAAWLATPYEPEMNRMLDAWARRQYNLDSVRNFDDAWQAFEHIQTEADNAGQYVTASPAGHAVGMLSERLSAWQLIDTAEPQIRSTNSLSYTQGVGPAGNRIIAVYAEGARQLQLPLRDGSGMWSGSANDAGRLRPSGLVLAHAIWLANERMNATTSTDNSSNLFQQSLTPLLLRADIERRAPLAIQMATMLGGPAADTFLIRSANWTKDARWPDSNADFDWNRGTNVNRWIFWAAQLRSPAGRRFREKNRNQLFDIADEIAAHLSGANDNLAGQLPFLFIENDLGPKSIGLEYWPRFRGVVARQPYSACDNQLAYLVALGPAADPQIFVDVVVRAWNDKREQHDMVQFVQWRLPDIAHDKRAAILDGILAALIDEAGPNPSVDWERTYTIRALREARYLEIDDAASVDYLLKWLRDGLPKDEQPAVSRDWFESELPKTAARRPLLIAALAKAPEAKFRLLAVEAIRTLPTPENQALLRKLLKDPEERVRYAAAAADKYWNSLRRPTEQPAASLIPQRLDRIEPRGLPRRIKAEQDADAG